MCAEAGLPSALRGCAHRAAAPTAPARPATEGAGNKAPRSAGALAARGLGGRMAMHARADGVQARWSHGPHA